jgi:peptidoglycan/xylan/chitin deacetylase (PgdA/CDA1 family)
VLAVDARGDGTALARRLRGADVEAVDVPDAGVAAAVASSDVVVLEASCQGPTGFVAPTGSRAAAAVAKQAGIPVWLVVGAGRALPSRFWDAAVAGLGGDEPWEAAEEQVPLDLVDRAVGPDGGRAASDLANRADCAPVAELLDRH